MPVSPSVSNTRDSFIRQIHSVLSEPHPSQPEAQDYSVIPYRYVPVQVKPSRLQTLKLQRYSKRQQNLCLESIFLTLTRFNRHSAGIQVCLWEWL